MVAVDHVVEKGFFKGATVQSAPAKAEKVADSSATEKPSKKRSKEE